MKTAPRSIGKRPFVLWIGVLHALKRPLQVIDIAKMIPEIDFVMIGWTEDKSIAARLEIEKPTNLYYLGVVSNDLKRDLIEKCSAGLTTSEYEGFGLTPF
jgi:glycosyltransferase involved in cell wall biosynthesis